MSGKASWRKPKGDAVDSVFGKFHAFGYEALIGSSGSRYQRKQGAFTGRIEPKAKPGLWIKIERRALVVVIITVVEPHRHEIAALTTAA